MRVRSFVRHTIVWAAVHLLASILVVPATLKSGASGLGVTGLLTWLTKILYFPVLGLALYPRHWFPGHLIYLPIAFNSLLWGLFLAMVLLIARHLYRRPHSGAPPQA
jgi:hypothetical protein